MTGGISKKSGKKKEKKKTSTDFVKRMPTDLGHERAVKKN